MNSVKTKYRSRVNVYLCFRQLDGSVVQQSSSHPWNGIPINCGYSKYFFVLIQDQFLRNVEQLLDRFEVGILGCFTILSKMFCHIHSRGTSKKSGIEEAQYLHSLPERPKLRSTQENQNYKGPCTKRTGEAEARAENFGDLMTTDNKVLSEGCESRNNHRYGGSVKRFSD